MLVPSIHILVLNLVMAVYLLQSVLLPAKDPEAAKDLVTLLSREKEIDGPRVHGAIAGLGYVLIGDRINP